MNKKILTVLCICAAVLSVSGCSSEKSDTAKQLAAAEKRITALEDKISELEATASDDEEEYDFDDEIHEIYDDTAVVEAYKSGDDSTLTDEKDKYIYEQLCKAVDEIITDDMTDYEKEIAVYTYICEGATFEDTSLSAISSEENYSHTPYGFFHDKSVICVGNATTFKLFMDVLGIENEIIHSTVNGEHAWNIVKIEGEWYHVDITFDGGEDEPDYSRLNVTDDMKAMDGYAWNVSNYHECTSVEYNYGVQNAVDCESVYDIPAMIKKCLDDGKTTVYLKFEVPDGVDAELFGIQLQCIADAQTSETYYIYSSGVTECDDGKAVVAGYTITNYDEEYSDVTSITGERADIDYIKIGEAYEEAFDGKVKASEDLADFETYEDSAIYEVLYGDYLTNIQQTE